MFHGETPKTLCVAKKPTHESPNDYCRCASCLHHFVDTRLWKTKHSRKRLQNFRQSWVLSKDRNEIHQSQPLLWPSDLLYVMLAGCDWWISIRSVDNTQGWRKVWNVSAGVRVSTKTIVKLQYGSTKLLFRYIHWGSCWNTHAFGLLWYVSKDKQPTQSMALSFQSKQQQQSWKIKLLPYSVEGTASTSSWLSEHSTALRCLGFNCSLNFK